MKIGLYFGSFNPIHNGHTSIANYIIENNLLDEVWFVVSPQNPFKSVDLCLDEGVRLDMVKLAIAKCNKVSFSDVEFELPKPSYTVNTLKVLGERFPENKFAIIMGEDNIENISKWKDSDYILENYKLFYYPRKKSENRLNNLNIFKLDAPLIDISSTMIRELIIKDKDVSWAIDIEVLKYIKAKKLYKK